VVSLTPGLLRQCVFGTLRIGLYDHVKGFYHSGPGDASLAIKIATGLFVCLSVCRSLARVCHVICKVCVCMPATYITPFLHMCTCAV
jgi:hypothetical protein